MKNRSNPSVNHLNLKQSNQTDYHIIGESRVFKEVLQHAQLVAPTDMNVIIIGSNGTGKEEIAKYIHYNSERSAKPFITVDCGAIPKELATSEFFGHLKGSFTGAISDKIGSFEAANGGTLFLDEVGELKPDIQVKLLRAIQQGEITRLGDTKVILLDEPTTGLDV